MGFLDNLFNMADKREIKAFCTKKQERMFAIRTNAWNK